MLLFMWFPLPKNPFVSQFNQKNFSLFFKVRLGLLLRQKPFLPYPRLSCAPYVYFCITLCKGKHHITLKWFTNLFPQPDCKFFYDQGLYLITFFFLIGLHSTGHIVARGSKDLRLIMEKICVTIRGNNIQQALLGGTWAWRQERRRPLQHKTFWREHPEGEKHKRIPGHGGMKKGLTCLGDDVQQHNKDSLGQRVPREGSSLEGLELQGSVLSMGNSCRAKFS